MANQLDRRSFDLAASADAQAQFNGCASRLEQLITQRDADVRATMAQYTSDGVSEEYHGKEAEWHRVAAQVRTIIDTLRSALSANDGSAQAAQARAAAAVAAIG